MAKWIDIGATDAFPVGEKRSLIAGEIPVVVCQLEGRWHALLNVCPHAGLPIGEGELRGCVLTCPFHGYAYNVKTGLSIDFADDMALQKCPIRQTEDGRIEVDIESAL